MVNIVTSCSADGWNTYGAKFVETLSKYWPTVSLHIVSEDSLPASSFGKFYTLEHSRAWRTFRSNNAQRKWVHGDSSDPRPQGCAPRWALGRGYNFRFDAYKFSKKVFAVELVAEKLRVGKLLWFDADVVAHAPVPPELPNNLLPSAYAISCLARVGYHSECGFVGYNLDHPQAHNFIKAFSALYTTEQVFELAEWHDSWVFDWLRNKMVVLTHNIPHKSKGHPFINSELGLYFDHLKGGRKKQGRSNPVEHISNSPAPYWQGGHRI